MDEVKDNLELECLIFTFVFLASHILYSNLVSATTISIEKLQILSENLNVLSLRTDTIVIGLDHFLRDVALYIVMVTTNFSISCNISDEHQLIRVVLCGHFRVWKRSVGV